MLKTIIATALLTAVIGPIIVNAGQSPAPGPVNPTGIITTRNSANQVIQVTLVGGPGFRAPVQLWNVPNAHSGRR